MEKFLQEKTSTIKKKNLCWQGKKLAGKTPVLAELAGIILMKVILRQEDDKREHARISLNCDSHYFILS